jgi:hypothetical protein
VLRAGAQVLAGGYATFLLVVALAKLDGWQAWSVSLLGWLPAGLPVRAVRSAIPALEASVALLLLLAPAAGLLAAAALLGGFGIGILILGRRAEGKDCGCFGTLLPGRIDHGLAARNLLLAALAAAAAVLAWTAAAPRLPAPAVLGFALLGALAVLAVEAAHTPRMQRPIRDEGEAA